MFIKPRDRLQRGLTLIELIFFIVVVGIALAAIVRVLSFTTTQSVDPVRQKQALMIAESLLEEIELAQFTYCDPNSDNAATATSVAACTIPETTGPESGNSRPYDNVNDYGGTTNPFVNGSGQITDLNGNALNLTGYTVSVLITPDSLGDIAAGPVNNSPVLRITVTVSYDSGKSSVRLDGYRTRYSPNTL
jgi:MSHA pilin protein MshD